MNYYTSQLAQVLREHDKTYPVSIKVFGTNGSSKQLDVTAASIDSIISMLRIAADQWKGE